MAATLTDFLAKDIFKIINKLAESGSVSSSVSGAGPSDSLDMQI